MKKLVLAVLLTMATIAGSGVLFAYAAPAYADCGGKHTS